MGALRVPVFLSIPSDVLSGLSVKALSLSWQVEQLTSPVVLKRVSLKKLVSKGDLGRGLRIVLRDRHRWKTQRRRLLLTGAAEGSRRGQRGGAQEYDEYTFPHFESSFSRVFSAVLT